MNLSGGLLFLNNHSYIIIVWNTDVSPFFCFHVNSGILKINNEVYISLTAHLSTKACGFVQELSRSLQPVVKVIKLPQLEAWPQSWRTSRPTDGDIALYFFPPSARCVMCLPLWFSASFSSAHRDTKGPMSSSLAQIKNRMVQWRKSLIVVLSYKLLLVSLSC